MELSVFSSDGGLGIVSSRLPHPSQQGQIWVVVTRALTSAVGCHRNRQSEEARIKLRTGAVLCETRSVYTGVSGIAFNYTVRTDSPTSHEPLRKVFDQLLYTWRSFHFYDICSAYYIFGKKRGGEESLTELKAFLSCLTSNKGTWHRKKWLYRSMSIPVVQ